MTEPRQVPGEISVRVDVDCGGGPRGPATELCLAWAPDDPLAVRLTVTTVPDHPSLPRGSWPVLRDFLRYGLTTPTGDGDVRILPDEQDDRIWFVLAHPGRPARLAVRRDLLSGFLDRTERIVPSGEERSDEAVDALIERLLAGS